MDDISLLIENIGLPAFLLVGVIYFLKDFLSKFFNTVLEELKEDKKVLKEELTFNREVSTKLLNTNEILAKDVIDKIDTVERKIDNFIK